jgi:hypothetical protein
MKIEGNFFSHAILAHEAQIKHDVCQYPWWWLLGTLFLLKKRQRRVARSKKHEW